MSELGDLTRFSACTNHFQSPLRAMSLPKKCPCFVAKPSISSLFKSEATFSNNISSDTLTLVW